jgi:hypothetical protein
MAKLMSNMVNFRDRNVTMEKGDHFIMIAFIQENLTIQRSYIPITDLQITHIKT